MEIKTLEGTDTNDLLKVFNDSFSGYFIPFKLSEAQLTSKMLADKIDLRLSVGAFDNGKLIAFILHGFDSIDGEKVVYNGGTGVIPEKRGFGLTKQMYLFILPLLVQKGINKLVLEVIAENVQAIKSYEKSGFKVKRQLSCYQGEVKVSSVNKDFAINALQNYNWERMESFWNFQPTWQNSKNVINDLKHTLISLGAYIESQLVGYVIYNPANARIQQIAVDKNFRKNGIASTLIIALKEPYGNAFSVINVDKESKNTNAFFKNIGLENTLDQIEMELELNKTIPLNDAK